MAVAGVVVVAEAAVVIVAADAAAAGTKVRKSGDSRIPRVDAIVGRERCIARGISLAEGRQLALPGQIPIDFERRVIYCCATFSWFREKCRIDIDL